MECLPSDILVDIVSRLPVQSVLDCKLVCKRLLNLLSRRWDQFAKLHHQHQLLQLASYGDSYSSSTGLLFSFQKDEEDRKIGPRLYYGDEYNNEMNTDENFSYKTLQETSIVFPRLRVHVFDGIVGSCNGLICLNRYHHGIHDPIHICNPITGEYVNLPEYTLHEEENYGYAAAYGFGYVHSITNDQYKVVRIYYRYSEYCVNGEVQVYTIGGGSGWRTIGTTSYQLWRRKRSGIFVNGSLHWIEPINNHIMKIVAFNLADEEFRIIQPLPPYDADPSHYCHPYHCCRSLQSLRGNLCFSHQNGMQHRVDIWTLKENATEARWSKDFGIWYDSTWASGDEFPVRPLLITKKDEVLFVHKGRMLLCYDPKSNTLADIWDDENWELKWLRAFPHMNSFVSLKAMGESSESKKKVRQRSLDDTDY